MSRKTTNFFLTVGIILLCLALVLVGTLISGALLWLIWNALAPMVGLPLVTFVQAWLGWMLLCLIAAPFKSHYSSKQ